MAGLSRVTFYYRTELGPGMSVLFIEGPAGPIICRMKFTKMHGIGNDYVYVNGFIETVANPAEVARVVSDRHFGIGGDGLILILPSEV